MSPHPRVGRLSVMSGPSVIEPSHNNYLFSVGLGRARATMLNVFRFSIPHKERHRHQMREQPPIWSTPKWGTPTQRREPSKARQVPTVEGWAVGAYTIRDPPLSIMRSRMRPV